MTDRFDYQRQLDDERRRSEDEKRNWLESLRLARLLEEHRAWLAEFNRGVKHG